MNLGLFSCFSKPTWPSLQGTVTCNVQSSAAEGIPHPAAVCIHAPCICAAVGQGVTPPPSDDWPITDDSVLVGGGRASKHAHAPQQRPQKTYLDSCVNHSPYSV